MRLLRSVSMLALGSCALSAHAVLLSFPDTFLSPSTGSATTSLTNVRGPLGASGVLTFVLGPGTTTDALLSVTITAISGSIVSSVNIFPLPNARGGIGYYSQTIETPAINAAVVDYYEIQFGSFSGVSFDQPIRDISLDIPSMKATPGPAAALSFALMALRRRKRA